MTGDAVRLEQHGTIPPPPDHDGDSTSERYEFVAVAAGEATIAVPIRNAGDKSTAEDFSITVTVTAAVAPATLFIATAVRSLEPDGS